MADIRVVIVDDHAILRDGIRTMLERQDDIIVVGEASNGKEAITIVSKLVPDIVLMDITMPKMNGLEATHFIHQAYPQVRVLVLTQHEDREFVKPLLQAGASGYILKKSGGRELVNAIREVMEQGAFLESTITRRLLDDYAKPDRIAPSPAFHLTEREKEVLYLLANGKSNKEIAYLLNISPKTVSVHRSNIMKKLEVHNLFELLHKVSDYDLLRNVPSLENINPLD